MKYDSYLKESKVPRNFQSNNWSSTIHYPRQKKRLSLYLTINIFDIYRTKLCLFIFLETTNTSELFLICVLVNFRATKVFIKQGFMEKYHLNTCKLSKFVSIYNIDDIPNKAGQILKVVYIVYYYKFTQRVNFTCTFHSMQVRPDP